jgi:fructose-bisphosphate aldolase class II
MKSSLAFLRDAEKRDKWDPPSLFRAVQAQTVDLTAGLMRTFGSAGKAG